MALVPAPFAAGTIAPIIAANFNAERYLGGRNGAIDMYDVVSAIPNQLDNGPPLLLATNCRV